MRKNTKKMMKKTQMTTKKMKVKKMMMKRMKMRKIVKKMRKKDMKRMKALLMKSKTNKKLQRNPPILTTISQLTMMNQNLFSTPTLILKRKSLKNKRLQELLLKRQRLKVYLKFSNKKSNFQ